MRFNFFGFSAFFLIGVASSVQADSFSDLSEKHLMHKIIQNERNCVQCYEDGKIFLNPSKISFASQGLVLELGRGESVPLPLVQVNYTGYFLEHGFSNALTLALEKKQSKKCCACFQPVSSSGRCQNPACEFFGFKVDTVD